MSSEQQKVAIITGASQGIGASIVAAYRAKAFTEYTQDDYDAVTGVNLAGFLPHHPAGNRAHARPRAAATSSPSRPASSRTQTPASRPCWPR
jgi:hypothetical protein